MESMFFQKPNNKELYRALLLERECCRCRAINSEHNCKSCSLIDIDKQVEAIDVLLDIVKARSPELYLSSDLNELQKIVSEIDGGEQHNE